MLRVTIVIKLSVVCRYPLGFFSALSSGIFPLPIRSSRVLPFALNVCRLVGKFVFSVSILPFSCLSCHSPITFPETGARPFPVSNLRSHQYCQLRTPFCGPGHPPRRVFLLRRGPRNKRRVLHDSARMKSMHIVEYWDAASRLFESREMPQSPPHFPLPSAQLPSLHPLELEHARQIL